MSYPKELSVKRIFTVTVVGKCVINDPIVNLFIFCNLWETHATL